MYDVFDGFLRTDTWYTDEVPDRRRFFECLDKIVDKDDFDPEKMRDYFRSKKSLDDEGIFEHAMADLVRDAEAVRDYLKVVR